MKKTASGLFKVTVHEQGIVVTYSPFFKIFMLLVMTVCTYGLFYVSFGICGMNPLRLSVWCFILLILLSPILHFLITFRFIVQFDSAKRVMIVRKVFGYKRYPVAGPFEAKKAFSEKIVNIKFLYDGKMILFIFDDIPVLGPVVDWLEEYCPKS